VGSTSQLACAMDGDGSCRAACWQSPPARRAPKPRTLLSCPALPFPAASPVLPPQPSLC